MTTVSIAPERTATVGLAGHGLIQAALQRRLSSTRQIAPEHEDQLEGCSVVVLAADGWDPALHASVNAACLDRGIPWLPAWIEPGSAVIGPFVLPGQPGCARCAETRRHAARRDVKEFSELVERCAGRLAAPPASWLTTASVELIATLAADEVARITARPEQARTRNALVCLNLATLQTSVHRFLPDPLCEACGDLPDDTAEAARIAIQPRPKASPSGYRVRPLSLAEDRDRLLARYVDAEAGLMPSLTKNADSTFPGAWPPVGLRGSFYRSNGSGRTLDYQAAEITAITEAIERYAGLRAGGRRTAARGSYHELADTALDPTRLGLPSEAQYALPGYPYQRYHHDLTLDWVWGYSFAQARPLLVPERYAYYGGRHRTHADRAFVSETSNGCALGGCLEEAILYGLLEVAERDAFLVTWYARLPVPRIEAASLRGTTSALMIERIECVSGYTVHLFDITMEQGIPCVWAMAVDEGDRPGLPKALCAAGSHLDPEKALTGALLELARHPQRASRTYLKHRDRILEMVTDPFMVKEMADHELLYSAPEAFERFSFLLDTPRTRTFAEAFRGSDRPPSSDLSDDLRWAIGRYLDSGLDVIVVDQTAPEHAAERFACVKVIVPGAVPMVFGYHAQRVHGLDRLYRAGCELGYHPLPLTHEQLNPHPHPFP